MRATSKRTNLDELMKAVRRVHETFFSKDTLSVLDITDVKLISDPSGKEVWLAEKSSHWSDMFGSEPVYAWHIRPVNTKTLEFGPLVEAEGKMLLFNTWEEVEKWVSAYLG